MKTRIIWIIVLLSFVLFPFHQVSNAADITLNNTPTRVCFSPQGGCTNAIVSQINNATSEILVQAHSFISAPIAKALLNAYKRSVKVAVILDQSRRADKYTSAMFLVNAGIQTYIDDKHVIAHNKIMIVDKETVITGSFNFTNAAEDKNAENLLIIY